MPKTRLRASLRLRWHGWGESINERAVALAAGRNRLSIAYERAAWVPLLAAAVLWLGFATAGLGFYLGAIRLRRADL